jgi:hypothetical protein
VELDAAPVKLLQSKLREAIESVIDVAEFNSPKWSKKPKTVPTLKPTGKWYLRPSMAGQQADKRT